MTNQEIKSLARKSCKITYQGIYNYLKYIQCYSKEEIKVELIDYADLMQHNLVNILTPDENIKDKVQRRFLLYSLQYWHELQDKLELKEIIKIHKEYEARGTQDTSGNS